MAVSSGIRPQPLSDEEAIRGAKNRARKALIITQADLAFGLEGCVTQVAGQMFVSGWAAAVNQSGRIGIGSSGRLLLPAAVINGIKQGQELGLVMDEFIGQKDTRRREGAAGILTAHLITRRLVFETAVIFSLAPFLNPDFYRDKIRK